MHVHVQTQAHMHALVQAFAQCAPNGSERQPKTPNPAPQRFSPAAVPPEAAAAFFLSPMRLSSPRISLAMFAR